jgi:hypothetical protein
VKAHGDTQAEANETLTLALSAPANASLADGAGIGVIQNDDFKYARPKAASPMSASLVHAYDACTAPNRQHGGALPGESCAPPAPSSPHLDSGTPDANGAGANFVGSVKLKACVAPVCASADLAIETAIADVRCRAALTGTQVCGVANTAGGADYAGELDLELPLRVTDRANAPAGGGDADQGTVQDFGFPVTIPCASTGDAAIGGTCNLLTTANSLVPGSVTEGQRAIWELGPVRVMDAGPDGLVSTPQDAAPFAVQGVFAP